VKPKTVDRPTSGRLLPAGDTQGAKRGTPWGRAGRELICRGRELASTRFYGAEDEGLNFLTVNAGALDQLGHD